MDNTYPMQTPQEQSEIFALLNDLKTMAKNLSSGIRPLFNGNRFLSDSELAKRLSVSKTTLANYRLKGLFGFYSLEGKIIYSEKEIEAYLQSHYHPPFKCLY